MKKFGLKLAVIVSAIWLAACGHTDTQNIPVPGSIPGCVGSGCNNVGGTSYAPPFNGGDTEAFNADSISVLGQYVGYPLNNPGPIQVNMNFTPGGSPQNYYGTLIIRFQDGSILHNGQFTNGSGNTKYRSYQNNIHVLTTDSSGKPAYRIFLEDPAGSLALIIHPGSGTDTTTSATGDIYFFNFNSSAPNPLYSGAYDQYGTYFPPGVVFCWQIDLGPYDCRNFNVPPTTQWHDVDHYVQPYVHLGKIPSVNLHTALGI